MVSRTLEVIRAMLEELVSEAINLSCPSAIDQDLVTLTLPRQASLLRNT